MKTTPAKVGNWEEVFFNYFHIVFGTLSRYSTLAALACWVGSFLCVVIIQNLMTYCAAVISLSRTKYPFPNAPHPPAHFLNTIHVQSTKWLLLKLTVTIGFFFMTNGPVPNNSNVNSPDQ